MRYLILIILLLSLAGCFDNPITVKAPEASVDDLVRANIFLVQQAAGAYHNDTGEWEYVPQGLLSYLPGGVLLTNPVTGAETDPVFFEPDGVGSVSYRGVYTYDEQWNIKDYGYVIVASLTSGDTTVTNAPDSLVALDYLVVDNCKTVGAAAEAFATDNNGVYARNNLTQNLLGNTISDYLPGGFLLENPHTRTNTTPVWGAAAAQPGETGYVPIDANADGVVDGYLIDGVGGDGATLVCVLQQVN